MSTKLDIFCSRQIPRLFASSAIFNEPIAIKHLDTPLLHREARRTLKEEVNSLPDTTSVIRLYGPPGSGKTHLLRWLFSLLNSKQNERVDFGYYLELPKKLELGTGAQQVMVFDSLERSHPEPNHLAALGMEFLRSSPRGRLLILSLPEDDFPFFSASLPRAFLKTVGAKPSVKLDETCSEAQVHAVIAQRLEHLWTQAHLALSPAPSIEDAVSPFVWSELQAFADRPIRTLLQACDKARKEARQRGHPPLIKIPGTLHRAQPTKERQSPTSSGDLGPQTEATEADTRIPAKASSIIPLKKVWVENFRAIRDGAVDLHPQATVLFGQNSSGKTTILAALASVLEEIFLYLSDTSTRVRRIRRDDVRRPLRSREAVSEQRGIVRPYCWLGVESVKGIRWDHSLVMYKDTAQPKQWGLVPLHQTLQQARDLAMVARMSDPSEPLPLVLFYGAERAVPSVPLRDGQFTNEPTRMEAFDEALSASASFKDTFGWIRSKEDEERRVREARDSSYRLPQLAAVRKAVETALPTCRNIRVETSPLRMVVDFIHPPDELGITDSEELNLLELSDGFRTHLSMVTDIARRMTQLNPTNDLNDPVRGTQSRAVILIDEIDLHLHPVWQMRVLPDLMSTFPNAQFVVTTHSEQVLGSVEREHIRHLGVQEGEVTVDTVDFSAGATSERILIELMGTDESPPTATKQKLERYLAQVAQGKGTTPDAKQSRKELDERLPGDPRLRRADLENKRQFYLRQPRDKK